MHDLSLTLVVPCHNEATRLDTAAFAEWVRARSSRHLCFVDDASSDRTAAVIARLCDEHPRISSLRLSRRHGKAGAVRAGVLRDSDTDLVGFWDADLAAPLDEVDRLIEVMASHPRLQCVAGIRVMRLGATIERSFTRHVLSRIFVTVASLSLDLHAYDTQCGAKLFRRDAVQPLFTDPFVSSWFFDIELYLRLRRLHPDLDLSASVREHPLTQWTASDQSSLRCRDFIMTPVELYRISRRYR